MIKNQRPKKIPRRTGILACLLFTQDRHSCLSIIHAGQAFLPVYSCLLYLRIILPGRQPGKAVLRNILLDILNYDS